MRSYIFARLTRINLKLIKFTNQFLGAFPLNCACQKLKTVKRSIYGQDYNYYFALTNSLYCTVGEAEMRLSPDYFFGKQNMADPQGGRPATERYRS